MYSILLIFVLVLEVSLSMFYGARNGMLKGLVSHWKVERERERCRERERERENSEGRILLFYLLIFTDPSSGFDFKLDSFHAGPSETFDPHYGVGGYHGNGDITDLDNLDAFQQYVYEQSEGQGVHFVMADGVSV